MTARQADLFPEPAPQKPPGPMEGDMRGDIEGLQAAARRVEVWCGPKLGWRAFGDLIRPNAVVMVMRKRAMSGPTFDLGPVELPEDGAAPAAAGVPKVQEGEAA